MSRRSRMAALLFVGWLASRLGWRVDALVRQGDVMHGKLIAGKHEVTRPPRAPRACRSPGSPGLTLETASGISFSLDRGREG